MASVHDVAAYILSKRGGMSTMKLQKLCYYSQGWALAWDEEPLFSEPIRAWANGPVVHELFDKHRGQFRVGRIWPQGDASNLKDYERDTVDAVLSSYGKLTGQQLSDKTHSEPPWVLARRGTPEGGMSSAIISLQTMQEFFGSLAHQEAEQYEDEEPAWEQVETLDSDLDHEPDPPQEYYESMEYADLEPEDGDDDFEPPHDDWRR